VSDTVNVVGVNQLVDWSFLRATVGIVGGGASGTLSAVHLLRSSNDVNLRVVLFESEPGRRYRGVAYGTTDPRHLLNVRAQIMSAFPDEPDHFMKWARSTGHEVGPNDFPPRMLFAEYLRDLVAEFGDHRLTVVDARVEDVVAIENGFEITAGGLTTRVGSVVLAYGNPAPRRLATAAGPIPDAAWHVQSPWDLDALATVPDHGTVVLVGAGLTAVDAAITLLDDAPERNVVMVSRHGELPRAQLEQTFPDWVTPVPSGPLTADGLAVLVCDQFAAARRQGVDWRAVVDGLRAQGQSIWRRLDIDERRRFLAAHNFDWTVRRHRMAPEGAAWIAANLESGRLSVLGGGLRWVEDLGAWCKVGLEGVTLEAEAVINCTGPLADVAMSTDPLLRALVDRGTVAPDPLGLGLTCTPSGQLLDPSGDIVAGMYTVGPPTRGSLWESMGVPEIRVMATQLAQQLTSPVTS
jgi:uncharacterized NAD(P)/FAD-binding protein YdhS